MRNSLNRSISIVNGELGANVLQFRFLLKESILLGFRIFYKNGYRKEDGLVALGLRIAL